jgi:hypothetical protein
VFGTQLLNLLAIDSIQMCNFANFQHSYNITHKIALAETRGVLGLFGIVNLNRIVYIHYSGWQKSFPWPGKVRVCLKNIEPCKMLIFLI